MTRDGTKQEQRELVRTAFRVASDASEPDLGRIRESMPSLMARAAQIRAASAAADPVAVLGRPARAMLPKLAAVAALLVLVAAALGPAESKTESSQSYAIEQLILTGEIDDSASDILLDGLSWEGSDDG